MTGHSVGTTTTLLQRNHLLRVATPPGHYEVASVLYHEQRCAHSVTSEYTLANRYNGMAILASE